MRIRTQLIASALLAVVVTCVAAVSVWQTLRDDEGAENEQSRAIATAREVANLLIVTQEYAFRPDAGTELRWRSRHEALVLTMGPSSQPGTGSDALDNLHASAHRLPAIFGRLIGSSNDSTLPLAARRRAFLFDQLLTDTQLVADSAYRWSRDAAARHSEAALRFERTALAALALVLLTLAAQVVFVFKRVLQPLHALERATMAIERGDLTVLLDSDTADELGDLARRFDAMTLALKDRSEELNQEVELRRKSEKRIRTVTDSLPVLVAYIDKHQLYRFANAYFRARFGTDPAAMMGQSMRQFLGDPLYTKLRPYVSAALAGEKVRFEMAIEVDGETRHTVVDYIPDFGEDGKVEGFHALVIDITERKNTEMLQALSEERVRSILTHAPDAFIGMDERGCINEWNAQAQRTFGWKREEVLGRPLAEVIIPESMREELLAGIEVLIRTGYSPAVTRRIEVLALHRDGREIPVELSVAAQRHGDVFIANAFLHDITERKSAEKRMAANRKQLHDITDNVPAVIGYFDAQQTCQFLNGPAARMLGVEPGDGLGRPMQALLGERSHADFAAHVRRVLAGERVRFDGSSVHHGDEEVLYQAHLIPDADERGVVRGFYAMAFDVSVLKRAEKSRAAGESRLRTITDNLPVLISYIDQQERLCFANGTFREWMGMEPKDIIGRYLPELIGPVLYDQRKVALKRALAGERVSFELVSEAMGVRRNLRNIYIPDVEPDGRIAGIYTLSTDVTATKEVEQQLNEAARVDLLTGLANGRQLQEQVDQAFARAQRSARALATLFVSIGELESLLLHHGRQVVDAVLREVAQRLRGHFRVSDTVAHLSDGDFVLVAEGLNAEGEAELIRDKVIQVLRAPVLVDAQSIGLAVEIGVIVYQRDAIPSGHVSPRSDTIVDMARQAAEPVDIGHAPPRPPAAQVRH